MASIAFIFRNNANLMNLLNDEMKEFVENIENVMKSISNGTCPMFPEKLLKEYRDELNPDPIHVDEGGYANPLFASMLTLSEQKVRTVASVKKLAHTNATVPILFWELQRKLPFLSDFLYDLTTLFDRFGVYILEAMIVNVDDDDGEDTGHMVAAARQNSDFVVCDTNVSMNKCFTLTDLESAPSYLKDTMINSVSLIFHRDSEYMSSIQAKLKSISDLASANRSRDRKLRYIETNRQLSADIIGMCIGNRQNVELCAKKIIMSRDDSTMAFFRNELEERLHNYVAGRYFEQINATEYDDERAPNPDELDTLLRPRLSRAIKPYVVIDSDTTAHRIWKLVGEAEYVQVRLDNGKYWASMTFFIDIEPKYDGDLLYFAMSSPVPGILSIMMLLAVSSGGTITDHEVENGYGIKPPADSPSSINWIRSLSRLIVEPRDFAHNVANPTHNTEDANRWSWDIRHYAQ
ncbi:MAG: hypothetical protein SGPRY_006892 [Prymnesium sp.]